MCIVLLHSPNSNAPTISVPSSEISIRHGFGLEKKTDLMIYFHFNIYLDNLQLPCYVEQIVTIVLGCGHRTKYILDLDVDLKLKVINLQSLRTMETMPYFWI